MSEDNIKKSKTGQVFIIIHESGYVEKSTNEEEIKEKEEYEVFITAERLITFWKNKNKDAIMLKFSKNGIEGLDGIEQDCYECDPIIQIVSDGTKESIAYFNRNDFIFILNKIAEKTNRRHLNVIATSCFSEDPIKQWLELKELEHQDEEEKKHILLESLLKKCKTSIKTTEELIEISKQSRENLQEEIKYLEEEKQEKEKKLEEVEKMLRYSTVQQYMRSEEEYKKFCQDIKSKIGSKKNEIKKLKNRILAFKTDKRREQTEQQQIEQIIKNIEQQIKQKTRELQNLQELEKISKNKTKEELFAEIDSFIESRKTKEKQMQFLERYCPEKFGKTFYDLGNKFDTLNIITFPVPITCSSCDQEFPLIPLPSRSTIDFKQDKETELESILRLLVKSKYTIESQKVNSKELLNSLEPTITEFNNEILRQQCTGQGHVTLL